MEVTVEWSERIWMWDFENKYLAVKWYCLRNGIKVDWILLDRFLGYYVWFSLSGDLQKIGNLLKSIGKEDLLRDPKFTLGITPKNDR